MSHALPTHHLPDELLMQYAAGAESEPVSLFIATHLALCPRCRGIVQEHERVGGVLFDRHDPAELAPGALDAILGSLDEQEVEVPKPPEPLGFEPLFPEPLRSYVGPAHALKWRMLVPGVQKIEIGLGTPPLTARLLRFKPGFRPPLHTHDGAERTLVLAGGYTDDEGHFGPGDVAIRYGDKDHDQKFDEGEPCVGLFVNDGPLVPRTWLGKILSVITGA